MAKSSKKGEKKKHDIYQLTLLLARDTSTCMADIDQYAAKVYRRRKQVEKDKAVEKAYAAYKIDNKSWDALENLRVATHTHCNYTVPSLTSASG